MIAIEVIESKTCLTIGEYRQVKLLFVKDFVTVMKKQKSLREFAMHTAMELY